jgi:hypothetical protein
MKLVSAADKIGPGLWISIHLKAKHAIDEKTKDEFIGYMYILASEFPCGNCRGHLQEYLRDHPFEPYMNLVDEKGHPIGMMKYSWQFHNAVNLRLHKPFVSWQNALAMFYSEGEPCNSCTVKQAGDINNGKFVVEEVILPDKKIQPPLRNFTDKTKIVNGYFLKNK